MDTMLICRKCGLRPVRTKGQRYCRDCHNAYMRGWRKTHPLTDAQRKKDISRSYARVYLLRGCKVKREPCKVCGSAAEMHHHDYEKPLDVEWLCRAHHMELHREGA